jgi:hypothetical protein
MRVRDHREGDNKPLDIPPNVHPANARLIPPALTSAISQRVQKVVKECVASLPSEGRGVKPHVEGQIEIAIKDQQLEIKKSVAQLRDVPEGAATDAAKQCIETKSIGLSTAATGEADFDAYSIRLWYAI